VAKITVTKTPLYDEEPKVKVIRRRETRIAGGVVIEEWTETGYSQSFYRAVKRGKKRG
jgi:hypothetical protein